MNHIHWYDKVSSKCRICDSYKWDAEARPLTKQQRQPAVEKDDKGERRQYRECLAKVSKSCKGTIFGYRGQRRCDMCSDSLLKGNLI